MNEFRKRQSSISFNTAGTYQNQLDVRESRIKNAQMQQSISKRVLQFTSNDQYRHPQNSNVWSSNNPQMMASSSQQANQGNLAVSKSSVRKQTDLDPRYGASAQSQPGGGIINQSMPLAGGVIQTSHQNIESEPQKKGIFEEYQERWNENNRRIFRRLITFRVGDDGKIEDQLKLMITYLTIIFIFILFLCGFGTTFYFNQTNKSNIESSIQSQASSILANSLTQYKNSTEYIFKGYEFVLNYMSELILSKLEISHRVYNFTDIKQFPYKGPGRMRQCGQTNNKCTTYTGDIAFSDTIQVSLKCFDWCEFDTATTPYVNDSVYQQSIGQTQLIEAMDILNYVLESQLFDIYVTKIFKIYFGFEDRQTMFGYPSLLMDEIPSSYRMHSRPWYKNTRDFHIAQEDTQSFRVISTPYYDSGTKTRVVTISKAILAPNINDKQKRYLVGKGRFMGVASFDIRIDQFQKLFSDLSFYETGYLLIVTNEGKLLNEPSEFLNQAQIDDTSFEDLSIQQLISDDIWESILTNESEQLIQTVTSNQGTQLVLASCLNKNNFYKDQQVVIMLVIPFSEVYGEIDKQNQNNLENILISSMISMGIFLVATVICMVYVKKKIVQMVSAITELNKCALSLTQPDTGIEKMVNGKEAVNSKKEVMAKLNTIQKNSQSETIKELIKGFENQLKGISKLGKGGQNVLKNGKSTLKYEQGEFGGTQLPSYIEPLLAYLNVKREKLDSEPSLMLSQYSSVSQMQIKTITNQFKKPNNTSIMHSRNQLEFPDGLQPIYENNNGYADPPDNTGDPLSLNLASKQYPSTSHQSSSTNPVLSFPHVDHFKTTINHDNDRKDSQNED